LTASFPGQPR